MRFSRAITVLSSVAMCGVALPLSAADEPANARQEERQAERQERQTERQVERQTDRQERQVQRAGDRQAAGEIQWQGTDQLLATCVAIDNKAEIALAEFGASKTQNQKVKDFAQMLVSDHQKFLQKLQQYAPSADQIRFTDEQASASGSNVEQAAGTARPNARIQQTAGEEARDRATSDRPNREVQETNQANRDTAMQIDPVQLHRELASQCLTDTKKMLTEAENKNFEECFVGHQIGLHGAMISKLKVLERHSSDELAQLLADGRKTTEMHLKKAEQLMKDLDSAQDTKTREGTNSRNQQ